MIGEGWREEGRLQTGQQRDSGKRVEQRSERERTSVRVISAVKYKRRSAFESKNDINRVLTRSWPHHDSEDGNRAISYLRTPILNQYPILVAHQQTETENVRPAFPKFSCW